MHKKANKGSRVDSGYAIEQKCLVPEVEMPFIFAIENLNCQTLYINHKR